MNEEQIGEAVDNAIYENNKVELVKLYMEYYPEEFLFNYPKFMKSKVPNNKFPNISENPSRQEVYDFLMHEKVCCRDIGYAGW